LIGKKDIQVDWQADGEPLQRAAEGHANVTFLFPEDANHVLKQELRPHAEVTAASVAESYNGPDTRLDPPSVASIVAWLQAHA
ncbi:MAG: alpha/beta hydrolase, partial [Ktedonobacterales bacterium]